MSILAGGGLLPFLYLVSGLNIAVGGQGVEDPESRSPSADSIRLPRAGDRSPRLPARSLHIRPACRPFEIRLTGGAQASFEPK